MSIKVVTIELALDIDEDPSEEELYPAILAEIKDLYLAGKLKDAVDVSEEY